MRARQNDTNSVPYSAQFSIAGHRVDFLTDCESALEYLLSLDRLFDHPQSIVTNASPVEGVVKLDYRNSDEYRIHFDAATRTMSLSYPWGDDVPKLFSCDPYHTLLLYPIWFLLELLRQESSEYMLHASTVVRDGRAIVISGEAESGKTTTALHLCRAHGFSMFANDQSVVGMRDGVPWAIKGEETVNLRLSSMAEYAVDLAEQVFESDPVRIDAWNVERELSPVDLGVSIHEQPACLAMLIRIKLDREAKECAVQFLSAPRAEDGVHVPAREQFYAKLDLYGEITSAIRGTSFTPMRENDLALIGLFAPSLDRPEFVARRAAFLNALFHGDSAFVAKIRGPLEDCCRKIVQLFEAEKSDTAQGDSRAEERRS